MTDGIAPRDNEAVGDTVTEPPPMPAAETLGELEGVEYRESVADGESVTDAALAVYR